MGLLETGMELRTKARYKWAGFWLVVATALLGWIVG